MGKVERAYSKKSGFVAGIGAGAIVLTASALMAFILPLTGPTELLWNFSISIIPGAVFSAVLDVLVYAAKPLLLGTLILIQLVIYGILGTIYSLASSTHPSLFSLSSKRPWLLGSAYGIVLSAIATVLWAPMALPNSGVLRLEVIVWLLAFAMLQSEILLRLAPSNLRSNSPQGVDSARRDLLVKGIIGLALFSLGINVAKVVLAAAAQTANAAKRSAKVLSSYITPNEKFYIVSKNLSEPRVNEKTWYLEVKGSVSNPFRLTLDDLKSLPSVTQIVTLECIGNGIGGTSMDNAVWRGVPLRDLLQKAGVSSDAIRVAFQAVDDYFDSITLEKAMDPNTLVAYEMNGEPLPNSHGFPARLIVPGIYGMKNVKWLKGIEVVPTDYLGFWELQGWSNEAIVRTNSRIDVPGNYVEVTLPMSIGGVAFAGDRGISRVEVSFDKGKSWQPARLGKVESQFSWVIWQYDWLSAAGDSYAIFVRAVDGNGAVQEETIEQPFPDGGSGYDRVSVTVRP